MNLLATNIQDDLEIERRAKGSPQLSDFLPRSQERSAAL
jgi:hypothetical protein